MLLLLVTRFQLRWFLALPDKIAAARLRSPGCASTVPLQRNFLGTHLRCLLHAHTSVAALRRGPSPPHQTATSRRSISACHESCLSNPITAPPSDSHLATQHQPRQQSPIPQESWPMGKRHHYYPARSKLHWRFTQVTPDRLQQRSMPRRM